MNNQLKSAKIAAICDYLLLTKNIDEALEKYKDIVRSTEFLLEFTYLLNALNYPKIAKYNAKKIVDKFGNLLSIDAKEEYYMLIDKKEESYSIYEMEFLVKNNTIDFENDYYVWTMDDFDKSLEFDILFIDSLMASREQFDKEYLDQLVMNPYFLYSVNKIAYVKPYLLDQDALMRICDVIAMNKEIIDKKREIIRTNNFDYAELKKQDKFYTMNVNTMTFLMNLTNSKFALNELQSYYQMLVIEEYIFNNDKMDTSMISINNIYRYIDSLSSIEKIAKNNLIYLLDSKKGNIKGEELLRYNRHLRTLNSLKNSKISNDIDYLMEIRKTIFPKSKKLQEEQKRYYEVKESNKNNLKIFELLISNEDNFCATLDDGIKSYYMYSLIKFINEMPFLFTNYQLNARARYILSKCTNEHSYKACKVLERMVGK